MKVIVGQEYQDRRLPSFCGFDGDCSSFARTGTFLRHCREGDLPKAAVQASQNMRPTRKRGDQGSPAARSAKPLFCLERL